MLSFVQLGTLPRDDHRARVRGGAAALTLAGDQRAAGRASRSGWSRMPRSTNSGRVLAADPAVALRLYVRFEASTPVGCWAPTSLTCSQRDGYPRHVDAPATYDRNDISRLQRGGNVNGATGARKPTARASFSELSRPWNLARRRQLRSEGPARWLTIRREPARTCATRLQRRHSTVRFAASSWAWHDDRPLDVVDVVDDIT